MTDFKPLQASETGLIVDMMQAFYAIDNYTISPEISRRNFDLFIRDPDLGQAFLIKQGEEVLGYMIIVYFFSFEFQGRVALLDELYLNSHARGKGLGKKAVRFAERFALSHDCKLMLLEVEAHNERAIKLYEGEGLVLHPRQFMRKNIASDETDPA